MLQSASACVFQPGIFKLIYGFERRLAGEAAVRAYRRRSGAAHLDAVIIQSRRMTAVAEFDPQKTCSARLEFTRGARL